MNIETLLKKEGRLTESFQREFTFAVKKELLKNKLEADPQKVVKKIVGKYIKAGLQIGVDWINN